MPRSRPLLPAEFLREKMQHPQLRGFASAIYTKHIHNLRIATRNRTHPASPDSFVTPCPGTGFTVEAKRTYLHECAHGGDVLAVYELISMGVTPDKPDAFSVTPLILVF